MSEEVEQPPGEEDLSKCPLCGESTEPRIFNVDDFELHGAECSKCGKTFLKGEDVARYAEYRKGVTAAEYVIC